MKHTIISTKALIMAAVFLLAMVLAAPAALACEGGDGGGDVGQDGRGTFDPSPPAVPTVNPQIDPATWEFTPGINETFWGVIETEEQGFVAVTINTTQTHVNFYNLTQRPDGVHGGDFGHQDFAGTMAIDPEMAVDPAALELQVIERLGVQNP